MYSFLYSHSAITSLYIPQIVTCIESRYNNFLLLLLVQSGFKFIATYCSVSVELISLLVVFLQICQDGLLSVRRGVKDAWVDLFKGHLQRIYTDIHLECYTIHLSQLVFTVVVTPSFTTTQNWVRCYVMYLINMFFLE